MLSGEDQVNVEDLQCLSNGIHSESRKRFDILVYLTSIVAIHIQLQRGLGVLLLNRLPSMYW